MNAVKVTWSPEAKKLDFLLQGVLPRSLEMHKNNKGKDLVSEYMGGNVIVVTYSHEGQVVQLVFTREEIDNLPAEVQRMVKRDLASPGVKGIFRFNVK